jgi:hypothetical protein
MGALGFAEYFAENCPEQYEWYRDNKHGISKYDYRAAVGTLSDTLVLLREGMTPVWVGGTLTLQ